MKKLMLFAFLLVGAVQADTQFVLTNYQTHADNMIKILRSTTLNSGHKMRYGLAKIEGFQKEIKENAEIIDSSYLINASELNDKLVVIRNQIRQQNFERAAKNIEKLKNFNF